MHDKGKVFLFFKSNICYQAGAIKFCYYKLSSDSGKQVKGQLCIISPKLTKQTVEPEEGPRKASLAVNQEQLLLLSAPYLRKMKTKKSCLSLRDGFTNFSLLQAFSSDSQASAFEDAQPRK